MESQLMWDCKLNCLSEILIIKAEMRYIIVFAVTFSKPSVKT